METPKSIMLTKVALKLNEMFNISYKLFHVNEPSKATIFELMIYTEYFLLVELHRSVPDYYELFWKSTSEYISEWALKNGIINKLPCDYEEFVNKRYQTYHKELGSISSGSTLPFNILRNIYQTPLQNGDVDKSQIDFLGSMPRFMEWGASQKILNNLIKDTVDLIKIK